MIELDLASRSGVVPQKGHVHKVDRRILRQDPAVAILAEERHHIGAGKIQQAALAHLDEAPTALSVRQREILGQIGARHQVQLADAAILANL